MTTTFYLPKTTTFNAKTAFGGWRCRIERIDSGSCNIMFFDQTETDRFEGYAEDNGIDYQLV